MIFLHNYLSFEVFASKLLPPFRSNLLPPYSELCFFSPKTAGSRFLPNAINHLQNYTELLEEQCVLNIIINYIYIYIYIQGVPGGMCQNSGECSLS